MRPLVRDEKRRSEKYGEKYEFPVIFEKNKIRIKWEDTTTVKPKVLLTLLVRMKCNYAF